MDQQSMNRQKTSDMALDVIYNHFSRIADSYRNFRITDLDPIDFIAKKLRGLDLVEAADIGCGDGRYDVPLFHYLDTKLRLACVDPNHVMLEKLETYMEENGIDNFRAINSGAESLPFPSGFLDCVFTFNAIHHFNQLDFLRESARILKSGGYLFIYTRLREHNKRNIWGMYFPKFCQKETRHYDLKASMQAVEIVPTIWVESVHFFKYERVATLDQLIERVRARHYSTFIFYSQAELEKAIIGFMKNIKRHFRDTKRVAWIDEYALFTIRKDEIFSPLAHI
ncbi:class I SAM-dependent methyltransferase [Chloroflexota bacterium]